MDVIKRMITSVSTDKRVLSLLIGWCFGGFLEGMAGFGTAISIPASMLYAFRFDPIVAILVCLGIATIAAVFLLVWAVMKVENIGESLGAFIRS